MSEMDFNIMEFTEGVLYSLSNSNNINVEQTVNNDTKNNAATCECVNEQQFSIVLVKNLLSNKNSYMK
uniref:Uncharacterized protein n=1 Tax=viral metagenome TaxID=1070528 RepID=A0A6C0D302_9ZZZZ